MTFLDEPLAFYHVRGQGAGAPSIYENSVEGFQSTRHTFYKRYLRNMLLRQDIAQGKLGVGFLG